MANTLLHQPVKTALISMAAPAAFGMLMTFLFQLVDTYFVGQLGTQQLSAISFAYPVYFFIVSFIMGTAAGVSATVGKALGENNTDKARILTTVSVLVFMLLTLLLGVAGNSAIEPVFRLLGASDTTLPLIADYMQPLYLGMFTLVGALIGNSALMAKGVMVKTTLIMGIGGLVNLLLDYLLIFGMGPIPAMELTGAALATVLSWLVMLLLMAALLIKQQLWSIAAIGSLQQVIATITEVSRIAVPAIAAQILNPIAIAVVTRVVAQSGDNAVAAYGIVTRVESLGLTGILALSVIMTPLVAQNYGAGRQQRLDQVIAYSGRMTVYWGLAFYLLMLAFASDIAAIFTDNSEIIRYSSHYFYLVGLSLPAFGLLLITTSFFNGVQQPKQSLKLTLTKSLALSIPLAIVGSLFGLDGIWVGLAVANIASAIYAARLLNQWLRSNDSTLLDHNPLSDYLNDVKRLTKISGH
jgi:putative MATE family efflux protein